MKIYKCSICGNIVVMLDDKNIVPSCCGSQMTLLEAMTADEGMEKHVPSVTRNGCEVRADIGSVPHPMTKEHRIDWVLLETDAGFQVKHIKNCTTPVALFWIDKDDNIKAVYSYCNIHGLWVMKMK